MPWLPRKYWLNLPGLTVIWSWNVGLNCSVLWSLFRMKLSTFTRKSMIAVVFDCKGYRAARQNELKMAADVAAEKVQRTGIPFSFAPMSSRERRLLHLAFRDHESLMTESEGEGGRRYVVLYPRNYKPSRPARH